MQISANPTPTTPPLEMPAPRTNSTPPSEPVQDVVALHRVAQLLATLQSSSGVRPAELARGIALAQNPNYPPPEIVKQLASLILGAGQ